MTFENGRSSVTAEQSAQLNALELQARHDLVSPLSSPEACRIYQGTGATCGQTANGDLVVNQPGFNQVRIKDNVIEFRTGDHGLQFEVAYMDGKEFTKDAGDKSWVPRPHEKPVGQ